jgi:TonB family protein
MKGGIVIGIIAALLLHALLIFFGGLLFFHGDGDKKEVKDVELIAEEEEKKPDQKQEPEKEKVEQEMEAQKDQMPDVRELVQQLEQPSSAPKLEALSLADLDAAIGAGGGDFGRGGGFASGGVIGGTGDPNAAAAGASDALSVGDLDARPRAVFQVKPTYPPELRRKDIAGKVVVLFVVDAEGKVAGPRIESSTDPAFERPALDAVRQWKYEPGMRDGKKVSVKMRAPITFAVQ